MIVLHFHQLFFLLNEKYYIELCILRRKLQSRSIKRLKKSYFSFLKNPVSEKKHNALKKKKAQQNAIWLHASGV